MGAKPHGLGKHPLYRTWQNVKERCGNPKCPSFHNYGGRGVTLNPAWATSFPAFLAGVGERPTAKHTLDRIDNNRGYEPGNVRWATRKEQAHNMRKTRSLTHQGRTQSLTAWAEEIGVVPSTLQYRLGAGGMTVAQALSTAKRHGRPKAQ
jgi:hypothetical protein